MSAGSQHLSRRELQKGEIICTRVEVTAARVQADHPSCSTVRTLLCISDHGGHLRHREDGYRYVDCSTRTRAAESKAALRRMVQTFFDGSLVEAVATLVDSANANLRPAEIKRIEAIIKKAKSK